MMKKVLRWMGIAFAAVVLCIGLFLFGMRFADGPRGIVAGGPFTTGELVEGPEPDWGFIRDKMTVEFQLEEPARSRTTWIMEHEGKIYIVSGYMTTTWGKIWKKWPAEAEKDGRAILRVDGKLYERRLLRLTEGPAIEPIVKRLGEKYKVPVTLEAVQSGYLWVFEMAPRDAQG